MKLAFAFQDYQFLLDDDAISDDDKSIFKRILGRTASMDETKSCFLLLTRMLEIHFKKSAVVILDEYDVPIAKASSNGYYSQMLDVMRAMMSTTLKDNTSLDFAVITGCLKIAKESIFTGTNNFVSDTILSPRLSESFGFAQTDVDQMLKDAGLESQSAEIKAWYDGYHFGDADIYCPWDVISYLRDFQYGVAPVSYTHLGCYIQLEKYAAKYVLDNISASYDRASGLVARAAAFTEDTGLPLTLGNFLDYYHLDPRAIYSKKICFSRLCVRAGAASDFAEPLEETMTKAFARFAVIDSRRWIRFLLGLLPKLDNTDFAALPPVEQRMLQMFYVTLWGKTAESWEDEEVLDNLYALSDSPVLLGELQALLQYQYDRIDFIDEPVDVGFDCPLDLHCTYTRDQLLVALDFLKPATVREGVKWLPEKQLDVFFVTLNKADKDYSPTTMYKDYSINESLFHWQSQSTTAENSATGQRYIHHREKGSRVLLFVREFKAEARFGGAGAYTYLGTVNYVKHEGSRPMNITWRLNRPIPAKFLKKTNKLVVG